jgi:hypothetical protein
MEDKINQVYQQVIDLEKELELKKKLLFDRIDQFLSKNPPFKGNMTFEEDIGSYKLLVDYAEMVNDMEIVVEWGTKPLLYHYPLLNNGNQNYRLYLEYFENLSAKESNQFKRKAYWEISNFFDYLIEIRNF